MQLDIFEHSHDIMLRNDVVRALEQGDAASARKAWTALAEEFPRDDTLPALLVLVEAIERLDRSAFRDHDALRHARQALEDQVQPAALRTFGDAGAAVWLGPWWRLLAQRSALMTFRADRADDHAAPLWLRAGDWKAAADAVSTIESWRRIPVPLAWMLQARVHLLGLKPTWPLLVELAWLAPRRLEEVLRQSTHPMLQQLKRQFDAGFEGSGDSSDLAWFPAWVLTQRTELAEHLSAALASQQTAPERSMRVLVELIGLEGQGRHHDIVSRRKSLRDLNESLYAAYMKTR